MTILKGYDIMYIKINWKMRKWSIVEKTKKKNWIIAIIVAQTVDNRPLFGGGCLFSV